VSRLWRTLWCAAALLAVGADVHAQRNWSQKVVPIYSPAQLMAGLHREWTAPQAHVLATQAHEMVLAIDAYCVQPVPHQARLLEAARGQWRTATSAWELLSAVSVGPVLARRSLRQIDFTPTRPALIEKAIKAAPKGEAAMALVEAACVARHGSVRLRWRGGA
jgi:predicted lipoprotein